MQNTVPEQNPAAPYQWSGARQVPAIGDRATISFNELGAGEVIGYEVIDGYLGVWMRLDRDPEWRLRAGYAGEPALIFGAELVEQRAAQ